MLILSGSSRAYGFDLDLIKSASICSSSSSPASTLSENSNSTYAISTKRARTPRKRPNQSYSEAAALLSSINPTLFSSKNLHKFSKHSKPFSSSSPYSVLNEGSLLIEDSSPCHHKPLYRFEPKPTSSKEKSCTDYEEPNSYSDYDVESILNEVGEGIDSIMGNLSIDGYNTNSISYVDSCIGSLTGIGVSRSCIGKAIRATHNGDWWKPITQVKFQDIVPQLNPKKKKKSKSKSKKKAEKDEVKIESKFNSESKKPVTNTNGSKFSDNLTDEGLKRGLGLRLNYQVVLEAWSENNFPFTNESGKIESSADIHARLSKIDLIPDDEDGNRKASCGRYKEKRKNKLSSSTTRKIRYQVKKVNADCTKMKAIGRFVRSHDNLVQETVEGENQ